MNQFDYIYFIRYGCSLRELRRQQPKNFGILEEQRTRYLINPANFRRSKNENLWNLKYAILISLKTATFLKLKICYFYKSKNLGE